MNQKNDFRIERSIIREKLIGTLTAKNFNPDLYVKTSLPKEWLPSHKEHKLTRITSSDYEETIIKFLEMKAEKNLSHPLLIIVGGTGSGKSTTIQYSLYKAQFCKNCSEKDHCEETHKQLIEIDFLKNSTEVSKQDDYSGDYILEDHLNSPIQINESDYWSLIIHKLDNLINGNLSPEVEISHFWNWLINDSDTIIFEDLYRKLHHKKHLLDNSKKNSGELFKIRDSIYENFTQESLCYYKVFQIAYLRRKTIGNCNIIVFDNIDSIPPYLQRRSLKMALKFCEILHCRAIIPMRPHTVILNNHAANFMEVIEHWTPDIFDVIKARNIEFAKHSMETKGFAEKISKLIIFIRDNKYRNEAFVSTCASSTRFALRNLYNLLLSPILVSDGDFINIASIGSNEFYSAFFCSEKSDQRLYEKNFTNLFNVRLNQHDSHFSNIKLRIIHYLFQSNSNGMMIKALTTELISYGYSLPEIVTAINDLILNRKPLIWSDSVLYYDNENIFHNHHIIITPLGVNYYNILLNHIYYLRECIISQDKRRLYYTKDWFLRCTQLMDEIEKRDYLETYTYLSNNPVVNYVKFYKNYNCISSILWGKIYESFLNFSKMTKISIDFKREDVIINNIKQLIKHKELTEDVSKAIFG